MLRSLSPGWKPSSSPIEPGSTVATTAGWGRRGAPPVALAASAAATAMPAEGSFHICGEAGLALYPSTVARSQSRMATPKARR